MEHKSTNISAVSGSDPKLKCYISWFFIGLYFVIILSWYQLSIPYQKREKLPILSEFITTFLHYLEMLAYL